MSSKDESERYAPPSERGKRDYTSGSILSAAVSLSLPMALDQIVTALTRLVDVYFLGQLGPAVLAASSLGSMAAFVILSAAMGISIAGLATVARRVGEKDLLGASEALWQVFFLAGAFGIFFGGIGVIISRPLLVVLGAEDEVLRQGTIYLQYTFAFLVFLILNLATNRTLRGAGEARTAFWTMATGSIITAVLCPVLITGVGSMNGLGIIGSAVAVGIGQFVGWSLAMVMLLSGRLRVRLLFSQARPNRAIMVNLIKIAAPVTGQMLLRSTSRLLLAPLIAGFGAGALAAYGIIVRLMMFPLSIGFGLGNAAGTLVGQNLGAGEPKRASTSAWMIAVANVSIMALVVLAYVIWSRELVSQMVEGGPQVVEEGVTVLWMLAPAYVFSALGVVMGRSLDGAGDTVPAMWVNLLTLWLVQLPVAYALSQWTSLGVQGIWLGIGSANVLNALTLAAWFARGSWKKKKV